MNRREFCKKALAGVGGLTLAGRASAGTSRAGSSTAAGARSYDGVVSTRGHYEVGWMDLVTLRDGHTPWDYEIEHAVPGLDGDAPDEVVVFVHGWEVNGWIADVNFEWVGSTLDAEGYDHPVVGYKWDADTDLLDWWEAIQIAQLNGRKLAAFLADYRDRNPDATVRLMGHSLGSQVALSTVYQLDQAGRSAVLDSVSMLGAAVHDEVVATDERYGGPIARSVGRVDNFHSHEDDVLQVAFEAAEWDEALGAEGSEGSTPGNYRDQDVGYVDTHLSYFFQDGGCFHDVVATWRDGGGSSTESARRTFDGALSGRNDERVHRFAPEGDRDIAIELDGPDGADFDLYVTVDGRGPGPDDHDARSRGRGSDESVGLDAATVDDGPVAMAVRSYAGGGSYELTVDPAGN